jgi:hypothetical protein
VPLDNPEQTDPADGTPPPTPAQLREAYNRSQARVTELEAQAAETTRLRTEASALRAGIDVDSPIGQLFLNSYTGDATPEAIKTAFDALGVPTGQTPPEPPPAPTNDGPTPEEIEQQRLRGTVHGEANPPGQEPVGALWDQVYGDFHANMAKGMRRQDAGAAALDRLFEAAMTPNHPQRDQAVFDQQRFQEGR